MSYCQYADGDPKVLGKLGNRNTRKNAAYCCNSITKYLTINTTGSNGPIAVVMEGKSRQAGYSNAFFKKEGAALGSTIVMRDNAFMTEVTWEETADKHV